MALFSPTLPASLFPKPCFSFDSKSVFFTRKCFSVLPVRCSENGAGAAASVALELVDENKKNDGGETASTPPLVVEGKKEIDARKEDESPVSPNGVAEARVYKFSDPRWIGGTWDLKQFAKDGRMDWDSVIDAEARRRKWLEDNPQASSSDDPVIFDTSIIPWWSWVKRFHLPEAELLNGRAAMVGFFMAYLVDSLTGVGLVDQMGNFFCKTLLFISVVGVLVIRKNEDFETLKKIIDETTFYDKQWQAAWKDDSSLKKE